MTIYDDGGSHSVLSGTFGAIAIWGGTTLTVHSLGGFTQIGTGDAATVTPPESGTPCIQSQGSTLNLTNTGEVTLTGGSDGGTGVGAGPGLLSAGDSLNFSTTLTCTGGDGIAYGGAGAQIANPTSWSVSQPTWQGGNASAGTAGAGLVIRVDSGSLTLPAASAYAAGSGTTPNAALAIEATGSAAVTVAGGTFSGYLALDLSGSASVTVRGSGLSWSGGSLVLGGTGTLSGTIGGMSVSLTVLCTGATLSASGSGTSVVFGP